MFNPFKPAFGNMLQSVMTAPPNGGVAPAFRNPFAQQQNVAPTQPPQSVNMTEGLPANFNTSGMGGSSDTPEQAANRQKYENPNQTQSNPNATPMSAPEQPKEPDLSMGSRASVQGAQLGAGLPQQPAASLPTPVEAPPKPVPMPTEILQNAMADPELMRQAEDLRSVTKLAFWEAVGQGNVGKFLETETGKMLNFSLEQFGDTLRNFALQKGWMDPELEQVNKLSDKIKFTQALKAEEDLRMKRITPEQYTDIMENVVPYLDSKTPRQRAYLQSMSMAFMPVLTNLIQAENYGSQVTAQVDANEKLHEREQANLAFQKLSADRKYGLDLKQYDLARQQLLQQQEQFEKELGFKKWSTTLANDLALDKAKMDKLQAYTNAYQTFGYSTNTNVQRLQTMGELLQSRKRDYRTRYEALAKESANTNINQGPDWVKADGSKGDHALEFEQINGLIQEANQQMADVDKQLQAQGMRPEDNPMYHILQEQTGTGFRIKSTQDLRAADPTGVLLSSAHPIIPFVPGVGRPNLKPNQTLPQEFVDGIYDQLADPIKISNPAITALYTDPNVWAQAAAEKGWPVDGFENAKAIYQAMVWLHANPGATLKPAPANAPPPGVTPKKGPVYTRGGGTGIAQPPHEGGAPGTSQPLGPPHIDLPGASRAKDPDEGYKVSRSVVSPSNNWRYLDQYVPDGEVWYLDHPEKNGVFARFDSGELVTQDLIDQRFGLTESRMRRGRKK